MVKVPSFRLFKEKIDELTRKNESIGIELGYDIATQMLTAKVNGKESSIKINTPSTEPRRIWTLDDFDYEYGGLGQFSYLYIKPNLRQYFLVGDSLNITMEFSRMAWPFEYGFGDPKYDIPGVIPTHDSRNKPLLRGEIKAPPKSDGIFLDCKNSKTFEYHAIYTHVHVPVTVKY